MSEKRTYTRKTKEEKIAALNKQIAAYEKKIADCKQKIADLEKPTITMRDVTKAIKDKGFTAEQVLKALEEMEKN